MGPSFLSVSRKRTKSLNRAFPDIVVDEGGVQLLFLDFYYDVSMSMF